MCRRPVILRLRHRSDPASHPGWSPAGGSNQSHWRINYAASLLTHERARRSETSWKTFPPRETPTSTISAARSTSPCQPLYLVFLTMPTFVAPHQDHLGAPVHQGHGPGHHGAARRNHRTGRVGDLPRHLRITVAPLPRACTPPRVEETRESDAVSARGSDRNRQFLVHGLVLNVETRLRAPEFDPSRTS